MEVFSARLTRTKPWRPFGALSASHVNRRLTTVRSMHSETAPEKSKRELLDSFAPRRQVTVHTRYPELATEQKILASLKQFRPTRPHWKGRYSSGRQAVVILATPNFASWLEDRAGFIPKILQAITRPTECEGGEPLDIDVVCGCVDGLPPTLDFISQARGRPASEGFSILHGETTHILPDLLAEKTDQSTQRSEKPASLTFQQSKPGCMDITLPLANTLFKNGRLSTLLSSRWRANGELYSQIEPQVERNNLALNVLGRTEDEAPTTYIPATPLTFARPIESGLGNIVRTVKFPGHEGIQPASKELETKVHKFLERSYVQTPTIEVWALVIPEDVVANSVTETTSLIRLPQKEFRRMYEFEEYKEVGHWISKGATLCRVLSGGGGWGAKVGLLSLDPQTTYTTISEAWLDLNSFSSSMEDQQVSALGNIAKPGSYIQFFTPRKARTHDTRPPRPKSFSPWLTATVVGTVPSTIDNIPNQGPRGEGALEQHVFLRKGEFGCVSESGMFVRHMPDVNGAGENDKRSTSETKIDLPYSFIYKDFAVSKGDPIKGRALNDGVVSESYSLEDEPAD